MPGPGACAPADMRRALGPSEAPKARSISARGASPGWRKANGFAALKARPIADDVQRQEPQLNYTASPFLSLPSVQSFAVSGVNLTRQELTIICLLLAAVVTG